MNATPDYAVLFVKMAAGLILVVVLAVVLIRFVLPHTRRLGWGRGRLPDWAVVLARFSVEPRKHLYVVRVLQRYFLLGASENSLSVVSELSKAEGEKLEASS